MKVVSLDLNWPVRKACLEDILELKYENQEGATFVQIWEEKKNNPPTRKSMALELDKINSGERVDVKEREREREFFLHL